MAENTTGTGPKVQIAEVEAEGYCDVETGTCVWPGAASATLSAEHPSSDEPAAGPSDD